MALATLRRPAACALLVVVLACRTHRFEHVEECGNPAYESMAWAAVEGDFVRVSAPNSFVMRTAGGRTVEVTLPNLDLPFHPAAEERLRAILVGRKVTVFVGPSDRDSAQLMGEVHVGTSIEDVARRMLRAGMATFVRSPGYTMSSYSECLNEIAARESRQ